MQAGLITIHCENLLIYLLGRLKEGKDALRKMDAIGVARW
jgi:hypothetical protein